MNKAEREKKQREDFIRMNEYERDLHAQGFKNIAGIDEVGRGPLAGPVVAAAVVLPEDFSVLGINDSKKLSPKKRDYYYDLIMEGALAVGIGLVDNFVIDEINILEATKVAMVEAVHKCGEKVDIDHLLIDALELKIPNINEKAIIKGDENSISIAAASIIAKVTRDRMMEDYDTTYPGYDFRSNKGYGTKRHYEGLDSLGLCYIHRRTFLKKYL